ncbi:hypothetical protein QBC33DRAFT_519541 [Phialemonium atrogriseum]|uniref:Transmembrane protein n=1 Tax=Phialemonium atrogriseum TaxID=1093897 RepID=A0AAJ0BQ86_9PEZI|nr:uncharacterized protein QBC33DRAFT_519541 [Phialemonium atrogriseum]KAK1762455.1 hypothetical protein QBC33DRAFT_519541 [Phialemonium atrogriseum]
MSLATATPANPDLGTTVAAPPKPTGHPSPEKAARDENTSFKIAVAILATTLGLFIFFMVFWPCIRRRQGRKPADVEQGIEMSRQATTRRSPPRQHPGPQAAPGPRQNNVPEQPRMAYRISPRRMNWGEGSDNRRAPPAWTQQVRRVPAQENSRSHANGAPSAPTDRIVHERPGTAETGATYVPGSNDHPGYFEVDLGQQIQTEVSPVSTMVSPIRTVSPISPPIPTSSKSRRQRREERWEKPRPKGYDADTGRFTRKLFTREGRDT